MANRRLGMPVELYVTTSRTTTVYVQVTAPRYPAIGLNENFEITAGSVKQLKIDNNIRAVGTALETKGILVTGRVLHIVKNDVISGINPVLMQFR